MWRCRTAGTADDTKDGAYRHLLPDADGHRSSLEMAVEGGKTIGMTDLHQVRITRAARVPIGLVVVDIGHDTAGGGEDRRHTVIHPAEVRDVDIDAGVPVIRLCAASTAAAVVQRPARWIEVDVVVNHPITP